MFNTNAKMSGLKTRSFKNSSTEEVLPLWRTRTTINKIQIEEEIILLFYTFSLLWFFLFDIIITFLFKIKAKKNKILT